MGLSHHAAEEIARRLQDASSLCERSLRVVMTHQSLGEVRVYGRLVAEFMAHVLTNVLAPIWKEHPDLEPESMKGSYVESVPVLAPEARAALESFVADARAALSRAQELMPQDGSEGLAFGGLVEINAALQEIQTFMEHPRFRDESR